MASITIRDTGKASVSDTTVTLVRAYGDSGAGTELTLKSAEASLGYKPMASDDSPVLKKALNVSTSYFEWGESDNTGIQLPVWTIRGYLTRSDSNDMITLGRLLAMCQTQGYKELYSADDGTWHDIIAYSHYGQREIDGESTKTVEFVNIRLTSLNVSQSADKKGFFYTLNAVETN